MRRTTATTPIGTLTRKIHRHDIPVVSAPPITGPIATATPVIAPHTPKADAPLPAPERAPEQS